MTSTEKDHRDLQLLFWSFLHPTLFEQFKMYVLIAQVVVPITNNIKRKTFHKYASGLIVVEVLLFS